jgi:hypothetical protein
MSCSRRAWWNKLLPLSFWPVEIYRAVPDCRTVIMQRGRQGCDLVAPGDCLTIFVETE